MAAWNVFCLCDTACPPDQCWLSAVLPELQGLGDLLNEFLEQSMTLKSFSNFVVTSVAGSASHLTSQLVSIIHPMAQVIRWSCCPDVSRLTVQNSNTPGLGCPRCKLRLQSHPVANMILQGLRPSLPPPLYICIVAFYFDSFGRLRLGSLLPFRRWGDHVWPTLDYRGNKNKAGNHLILITRF